MKKLFLIGILSLLFVRIQTSNYNIIIRFDDNEIVCDMKKDVIDYLTRKYLAPIANMRCETLNFDEKIHSFIKKENAIGVLQIRPVMLKEVNRIVGYEKYILDDRYNFKKSLEMYYVFMDYWNPNYDLERCARLWNGGENGMKNVKTIKYYCKFLKFYEEELYINKNNI